MNLTELGGWSTTCDRAFAPWAKAGFEAGRVALEHRGAYRLLTPDGELSAEIAGQFRHQAADSQSFPAVGDWVVMQRQDEGTHAVIHAVLPRQSEFVRKAAGGKTEGQVVAANVDTVFLVTGLDGDFNLRRLERYLVAAWESKAVPVVVLSKSDTCDNLADCLDQAASVAMGVPIHAVSAATGAGLEQLVPYLGAGQTVALIGSSGVGKSTLTNHFLGSQQQTTQTVREDDSRGRHTTTGRHLLPLPSGALLIDTPGMRELQLWTTSEGLEATFADIEALAEDCRFRDCRHQGEPGCAVAGAVAAGDLSRDRLHSYHKLQREQQWLDQRHDARAALNSKRRWKTIHKAMRDRYKG
ncbi:ribosome small subunit-dependent GTPase A [Phormidium tenue]|uniref:Small ribosomal subunit biogenesis GTPase RsgA n=1 Tax=Phormidium tenue NIES-30 TaxID=549789 RepID=A0A1U7J3R9_9CYAN|nr:ribosome small subunit-dependent GTPase A [Phormidium tenue]MBD2233087.1 ribosome small subunit-dependent GTPase A [Phormidium tenue FACHB-1052]OKH47104.1 ribosome small subunit-dependent GTPase A [Phormidium tenue NIES-30]